MNEKPVQIHRVNSAEINRIFTVFAAAQELRIVSQEMERRVRSVPNGWRDLRLVCSLLEKLAGGLMWTVPPEKQENIKRLAKYMRIKVTTGTPICRTQPDEALLAGPDVDTLVDYAMRSCELCMGDNCRACRLGKTLDTVLACDRGDRGWWEVPEDEIRTGGMSKGTKGD